MISIFKVIEKVEALANDDSCDGGCDDKPPYLPCPLCNARRTINWVYPELREASERLTHQPKGGMCSTCKHCNRDCSHLDFDKMSVISKPDIFGAVIVKCTDFQRVNT